MTEITDELINKLEQIKTDAHLPLERRLVDTAIWYHRNKDRIPSSDVKRRMDFLSKAFDIQLEMVAMLVSRLHQAEGRRKSDSLWLANGAISSPLSRSGGM